MCAGSTLSLSASNIPGATYYWVGPNSFTSNVQNPVIPNASIFESGTYSVYATVNGCQGPAGLTTVTVNAIPTPPNGNSNSPVCNGQDLIFTINPPGGIYNWSGPNSFTSSLQNPTISPATMAANGNYSVTITLFGCTSPPAIIGASVGSTPSAPQPTATTPLCVGSTLSLSTTFSANVTYYWLGPNSFTAATQNPTLANITVPASGVYTVYGSINGCDGPTATITVIVDPPAFVDAGPVLDTICASAGTIALTGTVTGAGSTGGVWSSSGTGTFSPTNSLVTTYSMSPLDASSPSFQIVLSSVGGGCPTQTDVITFKVLGSPTVDVATSLNVCKNEFVPLSGTITGVTNNGTWTANGGTGTYNPGFNFVNGNYYPSSADTALGNLWFVLTSVNNKGCTPGKDSVHVQFITAPLANFAHTRACTNQTISFTDMSTPSPSIASYSWDFGDGSGTSNQANPVYTYSVIDTFTVKHIVILSNGCRDTVNKSLILYNSAVANFSNTSVCKGYNTAFTDLSTITPDTLVKWNWTFGDGGTSTQTNPQHLFANLGVQTINFTVTTSKGCPSSITRTVSVNPNPKADFIKSADYVLAYDNVQFTDQSTPSPVGTWSWTFGGNGGSSQQNPNVSFPDKGIYPIELVVTDNNGCKDTVVKDIYVYLLPLVPTAFTPNSDGTNDILYVKGGPFQAMSFRVYNSWGELLFTSDDQDKGWDGTYKGQPAPLGVYVWILDVDLYNGKHVRKTGDVTILK
jgi:gliding motility-associated-like protein